MLTSTLSSTFHSAFRHQSYLFHKTYLSRFYPLTNSVTRFYSLKNNLDDIPQDISKDNATSHFDTDRYNEHQYHSQIKQGSDNSGQTSSNLSYRGTRQQSQIREEIDYRQNTNQESDLAFDKDHSSENFDSSTNLNNSKSEQSWPDPSSFDPAPWDFKPESDENELLFSSTKNHLPVSPLMDENFYRARGKHRQPKERSPENLSAMQSAIRKNPYAWALTTPVRKCRITGVALPRFFLLDFCAIEDPKTGVAWYMPRGLAKRRLLSPVALEKALPGQYHLPLSNVDELIEESELKYASSGETSQLEIEQTKPLERLGPSNDPTSLAGANSLQPLAPRIGGGTYLLRSYDMIRTFMNMSSKATNGVFITQTMRNNPLALEAHQKTKLRPDMAEFVLTLKRRRVMEWLILVTSRSKGYLSQFIPTKTLKTRQAAAVILLGPPLVQHNSNVTTEHDFYEFLEKKPSYVPVFDLRVLLGDEMLLQLKNSDPKRWKSEVLVLKSRNFTMPILTSLWELEGYTTPLLDPS